MILDILHLVFLLAGAALLVSAVVGFLRFPDPLARLHAAGVAGTAGFALIVLARIVQAASAWAVVEYLIILVLGVVASATVAQAVAWAATNHPEGDRTDGRRRPAASDGRRSGT